MCLDKGLVCYIICWFDAHTLFLLQPNGYMGCLFDDYYVLV